MESIENYISNQKLLDRLNDYCLELIAQKENDKSLYVEVYSKREDELKIGSFYISLDNGQIDLEEFIDELRVVCNNFVSEDLLDEYDYDDEWRREQIKGLLESVEEDLNDFTSGLNVNALYEISDISDVKNINDLQYLEGFDELNCLDKLSNETIDSMYHELSQKSQIADFLEFCEYARAKDLWGMHYDSSDFQREVLKGPTTLFNKLVATTYHLAGSFSDEDKAKLLEIIDNKGRISFYEKVLDDDDFLREYGRIGVLYGNNSPELLSFICHKFCKDAYAKLKEYNFEMVDFIKATNEQSSKPKKQI